MQKALLAVIAAAVVTVGLSMTNTFAAGTHEPANKVSAAGAAGVVMTPQDPVVTLLGPEKVKTAKPEELILGVTAECVLTTNLTTVGNDSQSAFGKVRVWVEVDGNPVPVSTDDTGDDAGKVTFCNKAERRNTSGFNTDNQATIQTLSEQGTANGFNWMAINVGADTHTIEVKGELTTSTPTAKASATAAVGKRTLIVEPTKAANDETIDLASP